MSCNQITVLLLSITVLQSYTYAKLTLNKECGEVFCKEHTYCSPTDHICRPCDTICNPELGNHDANRCEESCQDFIHDELYAKKAVNSAVESVQNELRILKIMVGISLAMTSVVIMLVLLLAFKIIIKGDRKPNPELPAVIYNNKYDKSTTSPIRKSVDNNNGIRREPSESTLPEYSYDNPSMVPSPAHHV